MRRRREILRFCSATQHKSFTLTAAVVGNLGLFQGFIRRLQTWTEGDRELQAGTER